MGFADRLHELMAQRGWNEYHLCAELAHRGNRICHATARNWLSGRTAPNLILARRVADAFGVALDELLPGDTPCRS